MPSINAPSVQQSSLHHMMHGEDYWLYLRDSNSKPYPTLYQSLIASAQTDIKIWDPYFHKEDTIIFSHISNAVSFTLLTCASAQNQQSKITPLISALQLNKPVTITDDCSLEIAYVNKDAHSPEWQTHDRFLIIDETEVYLIGSSVAHHWNAKETTGIHRLTKQPDKDIVIDAFNKTHMIAVKENTRIVTTI